MLRDTRELLVVDLPTTSRAVSSNPASSWPETMLILTRSREDNINISMLENIWLQLWSMRPGKTLSNKTMMNKPPWHSEHHLKFLYFHVMWLWCFTISCSVPPTIQKYYHYYLYSLHRFYIHRFSENICCPENFLIIIFDSSILLSESALANNYIK